MANEAQQFSDALAAAVEKAARSVVSVDARHHVPASGVVWSLFSSLFGWMSPSQPSAAHVNYS